MDKSVVCKADTILSSQKPRRQTEFKCGCSIVHCLCRSNRELKHRYRRRLRKRHLKSEFALLQTLGSLSKDVFERRTSTGSGLFSFLNGGFAQVFSQITSLTVKKQRNSNFISSKHVKRENALLPVDVRRSKTPLLKLSIFACSFPNIRSITHLSHRF